MYIYDSLPCGENICNDDLTLRLLLLATLKPLTLAINAQIKTITLFILNKIK